MTDTIELCKELIERASVTPEDRGCQKILAKRLTALGFACKIEPFHEVTNLWAQHGGNKPKLCFTGHTDVVPVGDENLWNTPPFKPSIIDGYLYGRGIADMKGSLACMVCALEKIAKQHGKDKLKGMSLLITSDEEGPAKYGTKVVLEQLANENNLPKYCLVGEPSSEKTVGDTIKIGRRGSLHGTLTIFGIQGHVAYPELADNPIHSASHALSALVNNEWDAGNDHFVPTTFQITQVRSGTGALNVVPAHLTAQFNLRFCPTSTPEGIQEKANEILKNMGIKYELAWELGGKPFYTTPDNPLCQQVCDSIKKIAKLDTNCKTNGGTSDGRFFALHKIPVVELGPVNKTIHQVNECVKIDDLNLLTDIYADIVAGFL
jgi:succinyl-diaminopimelate desuccinylase